MNFKELYNQKNKKELLEKLEAEDFNRKTISFYKYIKLNDLHELRDSLYLQWEKLNILGRVYIAPEGINAQISIPDNNFKPFKQGLESVPFLKNVLLKNAIIDGISFLKLVIKVKNEIVAYGLENYEYDINNTGTHLNYKAFNQAIDEGAIVVDVRNYYEGEVGKFENAITPNISRSKELLPEIKRLLFNHENDKILMYCTGGIRCEKASSYLIKQGFKDVNQLDGGIIKYANDIKKNNIKSKFIGKNFVFDFRIGEKITNDVISCCHQCNKNCDSHINCNNQCCHILFIQCKNCNQKYNGCCSKKCANFIKLSIQEQKNLFKTGKVTFNAQATNSIRPKLKELKSS